MGTLLKRLMLGATWLFLCLIMRSRVIGEEEVEMIPSGCCDWPSCYDTRTQLCLDPCLNTWSQCPGKLFLMNCYSQYMSPFGPLPVQCFPDAVPFLDDIEEKGISGDAQTVREQIHQMMNVKDCHQTTGICRPRE